MDDDSATKHNYCVLTIFCRRSINIYDKFWNACMGVSVQFNTDDISIAH